MIKNDIAGKIYRDHGGFTMEEAELFTNTLLNLLKEGIAEDGSVTIAGFGKFRMKQKPLRTVVMPNGEEVATHPGERVQFLPSPKLKARVNAAWQERGSDSE